MQCTLWEENRELENYLVSYMYQFGCHSVHTKILFIKLKIFRRWKNRLCYKDQSNWKSLFIQSPAFTFLFSANQTFVFDYNIFLFQNDMCVGSSSRNGTCYTADECEDLKGTAAGSCAEGFGVCCISKWKICTI